MPTLQEKIKTTTALLSQAHVPDSALDARLLISHVLGCDRATLLTQKDMVLSPKQDLEIDKLISRRANREPVARILGSREFWGLLFGLNEDTLEPRPDSETLIETALKRTSHTKPKRLLDLGTGTGCLLLALLHEWRGSTGLGVDKSQQAVDQATQNAKTLKLDERASFQTGNWLDQINDSFDLIISNPPYITTHDMKSLQPEVRDFDPATALEGGEDGLTPYRKIIPQLPKYLNENGLVLFEVGEGQAHTVSELMKKAGLKDVLTTRDLGGINRCVSGWL